MGVMGLEAIHPKPGTSQPGPGHEIYPYLLRGKEISGPDQVWCADIPYIPMRYGFMYLVAVMDWWSRFVLAWRLSNPLEAAFCVNAWRSALGTGNRTPRIANADQGAQFTSAEYIATVEAADVRVSMDWRGRWVDNRFIERLWRSLKCEDIYLRDYEHGPALAHGLGRWFRRYNQQRPHQSLGYATPAEVYRFPESHGPTGPNPHNGLEVRPLAVVRERSTQQNGREEGAAAVVIFSFPKSGTGAERKQKSSAQQAGKPCFISAPRGSRMGTSDVLARSIPPSISSKSGGPRRGKSP